MRAIVLAGAFVTALASAASAADGVIEINQARAMAGGVTPGDTPGFPVTINQPGSYRLTGNLVAVPNLTGILIQADNVTIDLNGFAISNASDGIDGRGRTNIAVANGSILSLSAGIRVGNYGHVERVRLSGVGTDAVVGIDAGLNARVSGCSVSSFTRGAGIKVETGLIAGNIITGSVYGIQLDDGLVTGNVTNDISFLSLSVPAPRKAAYVGNNFRSAFGVSGGLQIGPNICDNSLCP